MQKKSKKASVKVLPDEKTIRSPAKSSDKGKEIIPSLEVQPKVQTAYNWQQQMMKIKKAKKS